MVSIRTQRIRRYAWSRCAREYEWSANIGRPIMRGRFSLPCRILAVQTTRPAVPHGVTSNRGVMEERLEIGAKTRVGPDDIYVCTRVCWLVPGRKEGSKTWLTVDRRSHQDTSPFLFLSLRFIETRRTIILFFLSRERETSLSLSLILSWWRKSVFHRGWNEIMEPELWSEARKNKEWRGG